jgi:hypothetical protein
LDVSTIVVNSRRGLYDVDIMRPSVWGNPYPIKRGLVGAARMRARRDALDKFLDGIPGHVGARFRFDLHARARRELRGQRLGCVCKPLPCHGDFWAFIADDGNPLAFKRPEFAT